MQDLQIPTAPAPIIVILLSEHIYDMFVNFLLECPAIVSSQLSYFNLLINYLQTDLTLTRFNIKLNCYLSCCAIKI